MSSIHSYLVNNDLTLAVVSKFQSLCGVRIHSSEGKSSSPPSYNIENRLLYYVFRFSSACGDEMFGLIPLLVWVDPDIASLFSLNFGISLTLGQLVKDWLQLPRPAAPSVARLERCYETEFGLPSTHAISGLLPISILLSLEASSRGLPRLAWVLGVCYALLVAASRLYLGVHGPLDIVAGWIIGLACVTALAPAGVRGGDLGPQLEELLYGQRYGALLIALIVLIYLFFYPRHRPVRLHLTAATST
jgi:hypothetical protein